MHIVFANYCWIFILINQFNWSIEQYFFASVKIEIYLYYNIQSSKLRFDISCNSSYFDSLVQDCSISGR